MKKYFDAKEPPCKMIYRDNIKEKRLKLPKSGFLVDEENNPHNKYFTNLKNKIRKSAGDGKFHMLISKPLATH